MNSSGQSWQRLRSAEELASQARLRRGARRVWARGLLNDPLGQGVIAISSAIILSVGGIWLLQRGHAWSAGVALCAGAVQVAFYVALVIRAFRRDKAIRYWSERRQLQVALDRGESYRDLLLYAFDQIAGRQWELQTEEAIEEAVAEMVNLTSRVLAPSHDDLAVLVVHETGPQRCDVIDSTLTHGSRWQALRSGKHCRLEGNLQQRLEDLAPHHSMEPINPRSTLWLVTLHDSDLSPDERDLVVSLGPIFEAVAGRWAPSQIPSQHHRHLRAVREA